MILKAIQALPFLWIPSQAGEDMTQMMCLTMSRYTARLTKCFFTCVAVYWTTSSNVQRAMKRKLLLRIAAGLCLLTCIAHLVGTFMEIPPEQTEVLEAVEVMEQTMVPMPVGAAKSYKQILDGNNLSTALLLLLCSLLLFAAAGKPKDTATDQTVLLAALALIGFAILSIVYFFPVPALFTGVAAVLALMARSQE